MKNVILKFLIMLITFTLVIGMLSFAQATGYIPSEINPGLPSGDGKVEALAVNLINAYMWIGYVIAIGMVVYIGIKYVTSSADERATMKGVLVKVVIGSVIIATSVTIINAVLSIVKY